MSAYIQQASSPAERERTPASTQDAITQVHRDGTGARKAGKIDRLERLSRALTLAAFATAVVVCLAAPLLAMSWISRPFPGFLVEQTLVATATNGDGWSGHLAGVTYPQRLTRVSGVAVATPAEFDAAISAHQVGQRISMFTMLPDGTVRLFPAVPLTGFPPRDTVRLFVLPYLVGLAYLGIGVWIYRVRGQTRPGRALAVFCVCTATGCTLVFDLSTTHFFSAIWTVAMAFVGGALISLTMRFPQEWWPVERRAWLLGVPYGIATVLAGWGLLVLNDTSRPWAYISAWGASYRYATLGIVLFIGMTLYRSLASKSPMVRRQARIVLFGSILGFTPLAAWFVAPLFHVAIAFDAAVFLSGLLLFPLSVGVAIHRYRLLEVDVIVNRTLVYGLVTAILAGVFTMSIPISQKLFVALTGQKSDAAIVIASLIVASAFAPLKKRLEALVDRQFKQVPDDTRDLRSFGEQVRAFTQMSDVQQVTGRLLEEAARGLHAQSGALSLVTDGRLRTIHTTGHWTGEAWISLPLEYEGKRYGLLALGPRNDQGRYTRQEFETLQQVATEVARAVRLAAASRGLPSLELEGDHRTSSGIQRGKPIAETGLAEDRQVPPDNGTGERNARAAR